MGDEECRLRPSSAAAIQLLQNGAPWSVVEWADDFHRKIRDLYEETVEYVSVDPIPMEVQEAFVAWANQLSGTYVGMAAVEWYRTAHMIVSLKRQLREETAPDQQDPTWQDD